MKWGRAQALGKTIFIKLKTWLVLGPAEQRIQAILLLPVLLAFGIASYFSLRFEPAFIYVLVVLCVFIALVFWGRGYFQIMMIGLVCIALGFFAAQIRTNSVYTPLIIKKIDFRDVEGKIERIEVLDKGFRLTLSEVHIERIDADQTPRKVRLKLWKDNGFEVGQRITGLASLNPPSPPVIPKGFDFQKYMYFQGIGAVGFFYKTPEIVEDVSGVRIAAFIEKLRNLIGARIDRAFEAPESGLARALTIGQRGSISDYDMGAIRAAGLAHMLAISGLHVGLFSGFVFFILRLFMSFFPSFALRYPIKKYAAVAAMAAAFFYMVIAGATIPTQRAMISVVVVFCAILLDRSPISLRVVAFAAFFVLLFFPESLMSASFQMSFAAVVALVAFYDWTRPLWSDLARQAGVVKKVGLYLFGVGGTTIIATCATAPLSLFHFQSLAVYGLLANIICVPLLAFLVMPLTILALVLMPLGLEGIAYTLMAPGLDVILRLAHFVGGMDGAVLHVPMFALSGLVFFVLASLSLIILRGHIRIIFVCVFAFLTLFNIQFIQYDALVSSKIDLVGIDANEPHLIISNSRKNRFEKDNWREALGLDGRVVSFPSEGALVGNDYILNCDFQACRYTHENLKISYLKRYDVGVFTQECVWADVVISADVYDGFSCDAQYVINRRDGKYYGTHGLRFDDRNDVLILERVEDFRGVRPWVQIPRMKYPSR